MQKQKARKFPDCPYCGERLEKKNEILPGLIQCPKCKNEHYFDQAYPQQALTKLSQADLKRVNKQFVEAYDDYEMISSENPDLADAHWGMFLSMYGIVYAPNDTLKRYGPTVQIYLNEAPTKNKYYLNVLALSKDKYKNQHFIEEGEIIDKIWSETKPALKKSLKKPKKKDADEEDANGSVETAAYKNIGSKLPKDYQIDPILENKIKNAEIIYMKANKFGRANKIFDEALETDPYAKRALWGKLLCKLQVSDFDLLGLNTKLNVAFPLFEEVMECHKKADENIYLKAFEEFLLKKFRSNQIFDEELYAYILNWKNRYDQHAFAKTLYNEIKTFLEKDGLIDVNWIHIALTESLRFIEKENPQEYLEKYIETAINLNQDKLYKDALKVVDVILSIDEGNQDALLIQLCATYRVPELTELHTALRDLKQIKVFDDLIQSGYQDLDIFMELRLAALELIENGNAKLALQFIDLLLESLPVQHVDMLNDSLLEFSENLIYKEKFKEAEKYVNHLIHNLPLLPAAHWCKLKIALGANTNFDVLMHSKKDLMEYPDFEHAINSTSHPEDYIKFYEIHDSLKQATPQGRAFKKMANKHYDDFEELCGNVDIHTFVTETVPKLQKHVKRATNEDQSGVSNIVVRSVIVLILVGFAFVISNERALFDLYDSNSGHDVAWYLYQFYKNTGGYAILGLMFITFLLTALKEGNSFGKSLLKGFLLGLMFTAIGLAMVAGIPWALTKYLGDTLFRFSDITYFGLSTVVVSGALFGIVIIAIVIILRGFHIKLLDSTNSKKAFGLSIVNMVILSLIVLGALAVSLLGIIK